MRAVLQRAESAAVRVEGEVVGKIGAGLLVLLGVAEGDAEADAERLAAKIARCRIFSDEAGKLNRSVTDIGGSVLVVSNFTLIADYAHGNRPSYFGAAAPERAEQLYEYFVSQMKKEVSHVETGRFGAEMHIALAADGPITIVMESDVLKGGGKA